MLKVRNCFQEDRLNAPHFKFFKILFISDKDRDLAALTEKLRSELNASNQKQEDLRSEIRTLQVCTFGLSRII